MLGMFVGLGAKFSPLVSRDVSAVVKSLFAKLRMYCGVSVVHWV